MKTYIVGNWKMNFTVGESSIYLHKLLKNIPKYRDLEVVIAPSTIALQPLSLQVDRHIVKLAAQNAFYRDYGTFTGETSFTQLRGIVDYAIVGHSERRFIFHEDDKSTQKKVAAAIRNRIIPIICVGETESERAYNETADVLRDQVIGALLDVSEEDLDKVIIAYDPVWAISANKAARLATPDEVAEAVKLIRDTIEETYGKKIAETTPILFGGSVNPSNAGAYLTVPGVNGLLMSNSSLILSEFTDIINTAKRVSA
ncbi:MAG: triose-phosphate isomerase [Candidatus Saccharibacteria bacterium]|nr:triose-phosphate isomerase [Candidatus Saccharibacteria bacterium]